MDFYSRVEEWIAMLVSRSVLTTEPAQAPAKFVNKGAHLRHLMKAATAKTPGRKLALKFDEVQSG
jgi:hypothetical protein